MKRAGRHLLMLLVCLAPLGARGQDVTSYAGSGLPFFYEHYTPQDYHAYPQNWAVVQDHRGLIYAANNDGVLEYDGVSWRLIRTATQVAVRSLAVDARGVVYVGTIGDFGHLAEDSTGVRTFVSLLDHLKPEER